MAQSQLQKCSKCLMIDEDAANVLITYSFIMIVIHLHDQDAQNEIKKQQTGLWNVAIHDVRESQLVRKQERKKTNLLVCIAEKVNDSSQRNTASSSFNCCLSLTENHNTVQCHNISNRRIKRSVIWCNLRKLEIPGNNAKETRLIMYHL